MSRLNRFRYLTDRLRDRRRAGRADAADFLDQIADLVEEMNDEEREIANREGWRGWPDLFDQKMPELQLIEVAPDPDDPLQAGCPPRIWMEIDDSI